MTNLLKRVGKRGLAIAAAALVALGAASVAPANAVGPGNIDPAQKGTIIIHKHENPAADTRNFGKETAVTTPPVAGVQFKYAKVNDVDVTTAAGWDKVKQLKVTTTELGATADAPKVYTEANGQKTEVGTAALANLGEKTNAQGVAQVAKLDLGVYLIVEGEAPAIVTEKAAPFLVTVPLPNPEDNAFLYTIHAYPKNTVQKEQPKKEVTGKPSLAGDDITWTISHTISERAKENGNYKKLKNFKIVDALPQSVKNARVTGLKITPKGEAAVDATNAATVAPAGATEKGQTVTLDWTRQGEAAHADLDKLLPGAKVELVITATVLTQEELKAANIDLKDGQQNQADVTIDDKTFKTEDPNNPPRDPDPTNPVPPVPPKTNTNFTKLKINKVGKANAADAGKALAGAKFKIGLANQAGNGFADETKAREFTTNDQGVIEIDVVDDPANGTAATKYWVLETEAPAGYDKKTEGQAVDVNFNADPEQNKTEVAIDNLQTPKDLIPGLPLTGSQGMTIMMIAGGALLAAGAWFALAAARRRRNAE